MSVMKRRAFYAAYFISRCGSSFIPVAVIFGLLHTGSSSLEVGGIRASQTLPALLLIPLGGFLADRLVRIRVLVMGDAVCGIVEFGMAAILLNGRHQLFLFSLLAFTLGAAASLAAPAFSAVVPDVAAGAKLERVNAAVQSLSSAARIVGPSLAGLLVSLFNPGIAILLDGISYLLSAAILAAIVPRQPTLPLRDKTNNPKWSSALREFIGKRWLLLQSTELTIINFALFAPLLILGPALFAHVNDGPEKWGLLLSASAVGGLVCGVVLSRIVWCPGLLAIQAAMGALVVHVLILASMAPISVLVVSFFLAGACYVLIDVAFESRVQSSVPGNILGRVFAVIEVVGTGLTPLSYVLAGLIGHAIGSSRALMMGSVVAGITVAACSMVFLSKPDRS